MKVKIETLTPYPNNPRRGDIDAIAESLETNGQYRPIVVQKSTKYVLAGNHTLAAAKKLGWTTIEAFTVNVDDITAKRIVLADNRIADLATNDDRALIDLLASLGKSDEDLRGTGFDSTDVDQLLKSLNAQSKHVEFDASPQLGVTGYAVLIDCTSERQQRQLLKRFEAEKLNARPLMT